MIDNLPDDIIWFLCKILNQRHPLILLSRKFYHITNTALPPKNPDSILFCIKHNISIEHLITDDRVDPSAMNDICLTTALRETRVDIVRELLKDERVNPNFPPGYKLALCFANESLLKVASECKRFDINGEHNSALVYSARRNWFRVIKVILKRTDSDPNRYGPFSAALCAAKNPDGYNKYKKTIQLFLKDQRLILSVSHLRMSAALDEFLFHYILTDKRLFVVGQKLNQELQKIISTSRWTIPQVRNFLVMRGCIVPSFEVFTTIIQDVEHCQEILKFSQWENKVDAVNALLTQCMNLFRYDYVAEHVMWLNKTGFVSLEEIMPEVFLQPSIEFVKKTFSFYNEGFEEVRSILNYLTINAIKTANEKSTNFVGLCLTLSDWKSYNAETADFLFARLFEQIWENRDDRDSVEIIQFDSDEWGSFSFCSLLYRCFVVNCGIYQHIDSCLMIQKMVDQVGEFETKNAKKGRFSIRWDPDGEAICYLMNQNSLNQKQTELLQFLLDHPVLGINNEYDEYHQFRKTNISSFIKNKNSCRYDLVFEHACKFNDYILVRQLLNDEKMTYYRETIKKCLYCASMNGQLTLVYNILTNLTLFMDNGGLFETDWLYNLIEETRNNGHTKTSKLIETFAIHDQKVFYYSYED